MSDDKSPMRRVWSGESESEKACLYDNSKECPVRKVGEFPSDTIVLEKACPMCPTRIKMLEKSS